VVINDYFKYTNNPSGVYLLYRLDTPENKERTCEYISELEKLAIPVTLIDNGQNPDGPGVVAVNAIYSRNISSWQRESPFDDRFIGKIFMAVNDSQ